MYMLFWKVLSLGMEINRVSGMSVAGEIVQLLGRSEATTVNHPIPHLGVGFLEIIVDNSPVVGTRQRRVLELVLCLCQSLIQAILSLRTAAPQATLQLLEGWGCQEKEASVEIAELDLLHTLHITLSVSEFNCHCQHVPADTYLHLDVQNTDPLLLCNGLHGLLAGTVAVATELGMLNKSIVGDQFQERFLVCEVVGNTVLLTRARSTSSVYARAQKTLASVRFEGWRDATYD